MGRSIEMTALTARVEADPGTMVLGFHSGAGRNRAASKFQFYDILPDCVAASFTLMRAAATTLRHCCPD